MHLKLLRLCLGYCLLAMSWVYFSDSLLEFLTHDVKRIQSLQSLKGTGFVLFTTVLLYLLGRRYLRLVQAQIDARRQHETYQPVEIRRDDYVHCFWQQRSRSFTSRLGHQSMEIARFGVLQAHLPRQRAHAIEPVASSFGRRTRLLAAMASWNSASTRSSPRCFTWRRPAAALSQPKWVSIQARIFRLRP